MNKSRLPIVITIDQGVNQRKLKSLIRDEKIIVKQVKDLEYQWPFTRKHGQPFRIGVSTIGGLDMIADDNFIAVKQEFPHKRQQADMIHLYSAYLAGSEYFLTNDPNDFIYEEKRLRLEALMPGLKIRTLEEFLNEQLWR